ncbi:MAG: ribonuclease HII [Candidatus Thermoplasmatota archaeon]
MIGGVDEAGRGPCIGPLVVAGLTVENDSEFIKMQVRDSKKLSPQRREILAQKIKEQAHRYEYLIVPAADIDDLRKTMTLNELEVHLFSKIIEKLKPPICYVDSADVNEQRFGRDILANLSYTPTLISKHRADERYPVVSAASILAKTIRDAEVRKIAEVLEKKLGIPMGSGYPADPVTKKFLTTWYETYREFPPFVRKSWQTIADIIMHTNMKKLDEY